MSRNLRQLKILDIISNNEVETQEDLAIRLKQAGFDVTQATVSRDIKELNLIKTLAADNKYKYVAMRSVDSKLSSKLLGLFRDTVISVTAANNLVVVKTLANSTSMVEDVVRQLNLAEIIGIATGSDCILVVCSNNRQADIVVDRLTSMQN
jgi:transcriptional regulator of arginine metabolism